MSKEQTALGRIKDEVAKENNYLDWDDLYVSNLSIVLNDEYWPIVAKRFARECCQATQKKIAGADVDKMVDELGREYILKSSITNKDNIVIL